LPHYVLATFDGDVLGTFELDDAREGAVITPEGDAEMLVIGSVEAGDPELFSVLVVEPITG